MSLGANKLSTADVSNIDYTTQTTRVKNDYYYTNQGLQEDTVDFRSKKLSDIEKKEVILKARQKAAGWSIVTGAVPFLGGAISCLYYGLRSDKTVAKRFNLNPDDKALIKKIKSQQVLCALPGTIVPVAGGIASYIYNKNCNPDNILKAPLSYVKGE